MFKCRHLLLLLVLLLPLAYRSMATLRPRMEGASKLYGKPLPSTLGLSFSKSNQSGPACQHIITRLTGLVWSFYFFSFLAKAPKAVRPKPRNP